MRQGPKTSDQSVISVVSSVHGKCFANEITVTVKRLDAITPSSKMNTSEAIAMMSLMLLDYNSQLIQKDLEACGNRTKHETTLISTVFQRSRYDSQNPTNMDLASYVSTAPPILPIDIDLQLTVTHFENLTWNDSRIFWDERDFGNVTQISRLYYELYRLWLPKIHIFQLTKKQTSLLEDITTRVTFNNKNTVYAQVFMNLKLPCVFDFSSYPYDSQSCVFAIYGSEPSQKVRFRSASTRIQPRNIFDSNEAVQVYQVGDYYVNTVETQRVLVTSSYGVSNDENNPKVVDSLIRVKVTLTRLVHYYMVSIALPVFCISIITYLVATVRAVKLSLTWILVCALAQLLIYWEMIEKLPPDQKKTPKCGKCNFSINK
uniref:Neur_chan_LBD domain-containing protein n=1 Tax=Syphacia muris TaxID=451379 RepID=A0A0N5AU73_9BILA